jgi:hypothetical protein
VWVGDVEEQGDGGAERERSRIEVVGRGQKGEGFPVNERPVREQDENNNRSLRV